MSAPLSPSPPTQKTRNSSIELLKLFAILMVVVSHGLPDNPAGEYIGSISITAASLNPQHFLLGLMHNLGQIGNDIFLFCSAWFLLDSHSSNLKKIAHIMGDCLVISIILTGFFLLLGYEFPTKYLLRMFFPISFNNNWFITCYLLLYAIHPLLNVIIRSISQRNHLLFCLVSLVLYCAAGFLMAGGLFFYSDFLGFIIIYFLAAYLKLYLPKTIESKWFGPLAIAIGVAGWLGMNAATNFLGLYIDYFSNIVMRWNTFINPFFILLSIGLFCQVKKRSFHNRTINYFSGLSLLIYILHCNRIIRDYVRWDYFNYIFLTYSFDLVILWTLLWIAITLVWGVALAAIYRKTLQGFVHKVCDFLCDRISLGYRYIEAFLLKLS